MLLNCSDKQLRLTDAHVKTFREKSKLFDDIMTNCKSDHLEIPVKAKSVYYLITGQVPDHYHSLLQIINDYDFLESSELPIVQDKLKILIQSKPIRKQWELLS